MLWGTLRVLYESSERTTTSVTFGVYSPGVTSHHNSTLFILTHVNELFLVTAHVSWINNPIMFIINQFLTKNWKSNLFFFVRVIGDKLLLLISFFNYIRGLIILNFFFTFLNFRRSCYITFNFLVLAVTRIMSSLYTIVDLLHFPIVEAFHLLVLLLSYLMLDLLVSPWPWASLPICFFVRLAFCWRALYLRLL